MENNLIDVIPIWYSILYQYTHTENRTKSKYTSISIVHTETRSSHEGRIPRGRGQLGVKEK